MDNTAFIIWILSGIFCLLSIITIIVQDIIDHRKTKKKSKHKKRPPTKSTEEIARENGIETREIK